MRRCADYLTEALSAAGVRTIFSLSGNQIMPIYDACIDSRIEIVHTRHEAAAVFMADAYAQVTGRIGVALVTAAPGAMNALGPIFSARLSESPVLLLTGDSPVSKDGAGAFQELDQAAVTAPLTKRSYRPKSSEELRKMLNEALDVARSGRPGPVHMALPFDVMEAACDLNVPSAATASKTEDSDVVDVSDIVDYLSRAKAPLILCGPAMNPTRTGSLTTSLADHLDAPVVVMESPRGLKDPFLGAFGSCFSQADLIVALGKPVDFTVGFGKPGSGAEWIVVNAESAELERARQNLGGPVLEINASPHRVAQALLEQPPAASQRGGWCSVVNDSLAWRAVSPVADPQSGKITSAGLCAAVQRQVERCSKSIVICDGGEFGQWAQASVRGTYRIINGPSGAIGGGPCYALGAKKAMPDATVVALVGDGTVGFHFAEFETAARSGTPFVVVVGNDELWNAEHQIQLREYGSDRLIGCQLSGARYDLAVEALGGHGEFVERLEDLDTALERALASNKVTCVNVSIAGMPAPSGDGH